MNRLLQNIRWLRPREFGLVQIFRSGPDYRINYSSVRLNRSGFSITKKSTEFGSVEEFHREVKPTLPIYVGVLGQDVLLRQSDETNGDVADIIHRVVPNLDEERFYWQSVRTTWSTFISVIRADVLQETLDQLRSLKYRVVGCSIGPICCDQALLPIKSERLEIGSHSIVLQSGSISEFGSCDPSNSEAEIDGSCIHQNLLPVLSHCINNEFELDEYGGNVTEEFDSKRQEELERSAFRRLATVATLVVLGTILCNHLLKVNLEDTKNELETELALYQTRPNEIISLQEELAAKRTIIVNSGLLSSQLISTVADRIAGTTPDVITLHEMWINPLIGKVKSSEPVEFETDEVLVRGIASNSSIVNLWAISLQKQEWISTVSIIGYEFEADHGEFSLAIELA